ncbi:MAG: DUF1659 domain-containing protein [Thermoanaerobacteraceae bacterium]|uniref:DUF1659 domain-containing protein n=1 Tax=Desulfofundulus thermobenzoicus TaxID=29376 RepID=A0A6N7INI7_9FIRM|nr:DUF1659 domain-containing protein [Desulfofundulus thermobenzoicus]MBE3589119.1 DUF1659 domain-containing protein [Thermoanaerobacteraceae bacterium]MQL51514.1 DUF1659 domain-containing protein [Desulfofundulus thermobenzoicus]HHW44510.1 DUF1659 domain-containing protein [Desulfotomaculum sp.]
MPVNKVPTGTVLRLVLQTGVDASGNPVYRNKNLNNVRPDALDQDLFDVAQALAGLQEYTLNSVNRIDNARLVQA